MMFLPLFLISCVHCSFLNASFSEYPHLSKMSLLNSAAALKTCSLQEFDEIRFEIDFGISFGIDGGWFDFASTYWRTLLVLLYGLNNPVVKSSVISRSSAIFRLDFISRFRCGYLNKSTIFFQTLSFWWLLWFLNPDNPSSLYNPMLSLPNFFDNSFNPFRDGKLWKIDI